MEKLIHVLRPLLEKQGYEFREDQDSIFLQLPNGFGELQIYDLEENDDVIGIAGEEWHTHSECLGDPDASGAEKVLKFISEIFSGNYLLIEEKRPGKDPRKTIEDDLSSYLKWLPKGTEYKIFYES